jgi:hypothetical protein
VPGAVAFAGTATTTFGQTASFTVPSAVAFSGFAATVFGQSGAISAGQLFTGTATVTFSQSGLMFAGIPATWTPVASASGTWVPINPAAVRYGFPMFLLSSSSAANLWTAQGVSSGA